MALSQCPWPQVFLVEFAKRRCQRRSPQRQRIHGQDAEHRHDVVSEEICHLEVGTDCSVHDFRACCSPSRIEGNSECVDGEEEFYEFAMSAEVVGGEVAVSR